MLKTNQPYDRYGSQVESDADRIKREKMKYGPDVARELEAGEPEDLSDLRCILGPNFCPTCD